MKNVIAYTLLIISSIIHPLNSVPFSLDTAARLAGTSVIFAGTVAIPAAKPGMIPRICQEMHTHHTTSIPKRIYAQFDEHPLQYTIASIVPLITSATYACKLYHCHDIMLLPLIIGNQYLVALTTNAGLTGLSYASDSSHEPLKRIGVSFLSILALSAVLNVCMRT